MSKLKICCIALAVVTVLCIVVKVLVSWGLWQVKAAAVLAGAAVALIIIAVLYYIGSV